MQYVCNLNSVQTSYIARIYTQKYQWCMYSRMQNIPHLHWTFSTRHHTGPLNYIHVSEFHHINVPLIAYLRETYICVPLASYGYINESNTIWSLSCKYIDIYISTSILIYMLTYWYMVNLVLGWWCQINVVPNNAEVWAFKWAESTSPYIAGCWRHKWKNLNRSLQNITLFLLHEEDGSVLDTTLMLEVQPTK
jgi:hypothetical protein